MDSCRIIQFKNKKAEVEAEIKKKNIKSTGKYLIDSCNGDFAIIFKTEDIKHLFDGVQNYKFIIASNSNSGDFPVDLDVCQEFDLDVN